MAHEFEGLVDLLAHNAEAHADRAALIFGDATYSHGAVFQAVRAQAAALAASGVRPGDRVLLLAGNRSEILVLLGAAAWLGAMLVPLNLRLSPTELAQQARDASPAIAIVDAACDALWRGAWPEGIPGVQTVPLAASADGSLVRVGAASHGLADLPRQDQRDLAVLMLFTAAVDGHARGAVLAQSHVTASAHQLARAWTLTPDDRWLGVLPLFHAAGIGLAMALLSAGGACILLPRFDPAAAVAATEQHRATVSATFAPMLASMLDAADAGAGSLDSLRIAMGLEPPGVVARLAERHPSARFWSVYGQAEVSSMVCVGLQDERPGAAGRAVPPSEVRVQDASGRPLAIGTEGEIAVRGPTVFLGYWDAEQRRAWRPDDPWHRTGDLGRLDEDGWLWFLGRAPHKQLIKTGGENVYPAEVEQALLDHAAVAEAFLFGEQDERWGESVHAHCVLKPGAVVTEAELIAFVEQRLARYKRPRSVRFLPEPLDRKSNA